jgi:hypothetical protein
LRTDASHQAAGAGSGIERLIPDRPRSVCYRMGNRGNVGAISICATGEYDRAFFMPSIIAATFLTIWVRSDSARGCEPVLTGGPRTASTIEHAD